MSASSVVRDLEAASDGEARAAAVDHLVGEVEPARDERAFAVAPRDLDGAARGAAARGVDDPDGAVLDQARGDPDGARRGRFARGAGRTGRRPAAPNAPTAASFA
jgi:hypothetical protein